MTFAIEGERARLMDKGDFTAWHAWDMPFGRVEYWRGDFDKDGGAVRFLDPDGDLVRIEWFASNGRAMEAAIKVGCAVPGLASLGGRVDPVF